MEEIKEKQAVPSDVNNTGMNINLQFFEAVRRFKSVGRAYRRGHITNFGYIIPNRPFHNRKNTCKRGKNSRQFNEDKKRAFYELRGINYSRL